LETGFTDYLQIVTTSNYNTITNQDTLQITTAHAKPSQPASTSRFHVTDLNNGDSSASVLTSVLSGEYPTAARNKVRVKVEVKVKVILRLAVYSQSVPSWRQTP
jgi:hypothetical protein